MTPPLRGLTEHHPYAFAIARLGKRVENRSQHPRQKGGCIGMYLAIHGGVVPKGRAREDAVSAIWEINQFVIGMPHAEQNLVYRPDWLAELTPVERAWLEGRPPLTVDDYITPGIVAIARLSSVSHGGIPGNRWSSNDGYQWHLADVTPLPTAIPYRGSQGLWPVDDTRTVEMLRETWAATHNGVVPF